MFETQFKQKKTAFIQGQWCDVSGDFFSSVNPANNQLLWEGASANARDVELAIDSAASAFRGWADLPLQKRIDYLHAFHDVCKNAREELAELISLETGKPRWESLTEVGAVLNKIGISITAYQERSGERQINKGEYISRLQHRPHGVLAVIGPFNFPAHLPNGHIIPALLAGNTVVFKPSEHTPMVGEFLAQCWEKVGLPKGVFNLVQGGAVTGGALSDAHPKINGVLFTGSYQTGQRIHQQYAGHPETILALEMGGNNPLIVWDVEDITAACYQIIQSAFITAGQRCTCARRLIISDSEQGDYLLERLLKMVSGIHVGQYTKTPEPFMGPVISHQAAQAILAAQESLVHLGGISYLDLTLLQSETGLLQPGIIDVTEVTNLPDTEYFGPLLQVIRAQNFSQAITLANQTQFGLSAGLLSDREDLFTLFYRSIRAGIVNWNRPLTGAASDNPFGGIGISGNGRASAYYATDYCAYPVSSLMESSCRLPEVLSPGIEV